ncbi:MAG: isopenicillin-N epimerase [Cyclobacteriaceae bacterium]|jgi:selenocysteine lyase/cysteine desulfurase
MNKREFLKQGFLSSFSLPFLIPDLSKTYDLKDVISHESQPKEDYWKEVRMQFPLKEGPVYFNNGTIGPSPGYVLNKVMDHMHYYGIHAAEIDYKNGSGLALLCGYNEYEEIRKKVGKIINADFKTISLTQNATFGMNYVANGLELKKGDEIVNTDQEHGGGFGAWKLLAKRRGCVYKQATMPVPANDPQEIFDAIFKVVTKKTKVIAIPHMVSVYGVVMPVKEICTEAKKRGIFTVLDGAQTVGQIKVDVKDIGCNAYYSSLHKWMLAPGGNGILYIDEDSISGIWSTIASYKWDYQDDHGFRIMQNGTGNAAIRVGLEAALDFYDTIGEERWIARVKELGDHLRSGLAEIDKATIHSSTNPEMCAGITTYSVEGYSGPELQAILWEREKLQPRSVGTDLLRHSVHIYNSIEEIDRALGVIKTL